MARIKATHHVVFIMIHGKSPEVMDMLRYDNCTPADEREAHKLVKAVRAEHEAEWIILKRFIPVGAPVNPTTARWIGFGYVACPLAYNEMYDAEAVRDRLMSRPGHGLNGRGEIVDY